MLKIDLSEALNPQRVLRLLNEKLADNEVHEIADEYEYNFARKTLPAAYIDARLEYFCQLRNIGRVRVLHALSWELSKASGKLDRETYLHEKSRLGYLCSLIEPISPDTRFFQKYILQHIDNRGYITLYRGVCREELNEFKAGNIDALGIWWTSDKSTALCFAKIRKGKILSWRVNIGMLRGAVLTNHHGEVHLSPRQVHDSGQCGKIGTLANFRGIM